MREAADIFLVVASVCAVLLTIMVSMLTFAALKATQEFRGFIRLLRGEVAFFVEGKQQALRKARFWGLWLKNFARKITKNNKDFV